MIARHLSRLSAAAIACCLALGAPARAATAVTNIANPGPVAPDFRDFTPLATSFTTGPAPSVLSSATVAVVNAVPDAPNTFSFAIWSDAGGHPGAPLESYPGQFTDKLTSLLTYTSAGLPLDAHTTYWAVLTFPGGHAGSWGAANSADETSNYGWTIGDFVLAQSATTGSWGRILLGDPDVGRFSVDATILPEPATLTFTVLPASLALLRRRRLTTTV